MKYTGLKRGIATIIIDSAENVISVETEGLAPKEFDHAIRTGRSELIATLLWPELMRLMRMTDEQLLRMRIERLERGNVP